MTDGEWWYDKDGKRYGPYSVADMERHLISKEISIDTMVWCEGMKGWTRMAAVAALQDLLTDTPRSRDGNDRAPTVDVSGRDPFSSIPAPAVLDNRRGDGHGSLRIRLTCVSLGLSLGSFSTPSFQASYSG